MPNCEECPETFDTNQALGVHTANAHHREYSRGEIEHGTVKGYKAHRRREETACGTCKTAWNLYYAEYRSRKGSK